MSGIGEVRHAIMSLLLKAFGACDVPARWSPSYAPKVAMEIMFSKELSRELMAECGGNEIPTHALIFMPGSPYDNALTVMIPPATIADFDIKDPNFQLELYAWLYGIDILTKPQFDALCQYERAPACAKS